jgi:predicted alpha/beta hydrolase family esterase
MRSRDTDLLFVPGLGGSGPDHWQSRWQGRLPTARRVEQADWDRPNCAAWVAAITEAVAGAARPLVVVAHSLGVTAFVQAAAAGLGPVAGAFLVSPPSAATLRRLEQVDPAFLPYPATPLGFPAMVVGSRSDDFAAYPEIEALAASWGAILLDAGAAGHINADSGHGPWPEGLMAFAGFLGRL